MGKMDNFTRRFSVNMLSSSKEKICSAEKCLAQSGCMAEYHALLEAELKIDGVIKSLESGNDTND